MHHVGQLIITSRKPQDNCRVIAGRLPSAGLGVVYFSLLSLQYPLLFSGQDK